VSTSSARSRARDLVVSFLLNCPSCIPGHSLVDEVQSVCTDGRELFALDSSAAYASGFDSGSQKADSSEPQPVSCTGCTHSLAERGKKRSDSLTKTVLFLHRGRTSRSTSAFAAWNQMSQTHCLCLAQSNFLRTQLATAALDNMLGCWSSSRRREGSAYSRRPPGSAKEAKSPAVALDYILSDVTD
jgi:hypothetical protein